MRQFPASVIILLGLALVPAALLASPAAAQAPQGGLVVLALPTADWGVALGLQDFVITESRTYPGGKVRGLKAERRASGMVLSTFIVPAPAGDSARACRDAFWERLKNGPVAAAYSDVRQFETADAALSEYLIGEFQGMRLDQKHVHAYIGKDGSCIELHLSKTMFESKDEELFTTVLGTLRLVEAGAAPNVPTARSYRVSAGDAIELMVPPSWQDEYPGGRENAGPTLSLVPATTSKDVLFMMTVIVPPPARRDGSYNAPDQLRKRTQSAGERLRDKIVEDKIEIEEIGGAEITGYMFTVTDKNPDSGPWNFRQMSHAEAALRDVMLSFSLFFQAPGIPERAAALEAFKSTRLLPAPSP